MKDSYSFDVDDAGLEASYERHRQAYIATFAPFDVHLVVVGKEAEITEAAEGLAGELDGAGVGVLMDDRPASAGVKFRDAELIGIPAIVVVGRRLAGGVVEVRDRRTGERREVAVKDALAELTAILSA